MGSTLASRLSEELVSIVFFTAKIAKKNLLNFALFALTLTHLHLRQVQVSLSTSFAVQIRLLRLETLLSDKLRGAYSL
jgi:hypothetical protein